MATDFDNRTYTLELDFYDCTRISNALSAYRDRLIDEGEQSRADACEKVWWKLLRQRHDQDEQYDLDAESVAG